MSRKSGNRFCDQDMLKQNTPGLFDIVKKAKPTPALSTNRRHDIP
jgi:hypothetical protein